MIFSHHDLAGGWEASKPRSRGVLCHGPSGIHPEATRLWPLAVCRGLRPLPRLRRPLNEAKGLGMAGPVSPEEREGDGAFFHYRA